MERPKIRTRERDAIVRASAPVWCRESDCSTSRSAAAGKSRNF